MGDDDDSGGNGDGGGDGDVRYFPGYIQQTINEIKTMWLNCFTSSQKVCNIGTGTIHKKIHESFKLTKFSCMQCSAFCAPERQSKRKSNTKKKKNYQDQLNSAVRLDATDVQ